MSNSTVTKMVVVAAILWVSANSRPVARLPMSGDVWILVVVAFGIFNAVVSTPGTLWIRGISVVGTIVTMAGGRLELFALLAWIVWPPAYMVSWALGRHAMQRRRDASLDDAGDDVFTPERISLAAVLIAVTIASIAYRLIFARGLHQSAALFLGIPTLIAVIVIFTVSPKSAAGVACKAVTVGLLMSLLVLGEGVLCVIMAAPLFYAVAIGIASVAEFRAGAADKTATLRSCLILLPVISMSLEGVTDATAFKRHETVVTSRVVEASAADVARVVFDAPRFDRTLPLYLRAGFPTPTATRIDRSSAIPRWVVTFRGGEMRLDGIEPRAGDLVLDLVEAKPGLARWRTVSDTSHMTHYLRWREMSVQWEPVTPAQTRVTCTVSYSRDLDPAWYFGPWQRYAVTLAAGYLIDAVATP